MILFASARLIARMAVHVLSRSSNKPRQYGVHTRRRRTTRGHDGELLCCYDAYNRAVSRPRSRRNVMVRPSISSTWCAALMLALTLAAGAARAADTVLQINAFPNAKALPLHA